MDVKIIFKMPMWKSFCNCKIWKSFWKYQYENHCANAYVKVILSMPLWNAFWEYQNQNLFASAYIKKNFQNASVKCLCKKKKLNASVKIMGRAKRAQLFTVGWAKRLHYQIQGHKKRDKRALLLFVCCGHFFSFSFFFDSLAKISFCLNYFLAGKNSGVFFAIAFLRAEITPLPKS